jgi:ribosomal protein L21
MENSKNVILFMFGTVLMLGVSITAYNIFIKGPAKEAQLAQVAKLNKIQASKIVNVTDNQYKTESTLLANKLMSAQLVNQVEGFLIVKNGNQLSINGKVQSKAIAAQYLEGLTEKDIRVQVFSLKNRLQMHPDAGFMQNLLPVSMQSECLDINPADTGC